MNDIEFENNIAEVKPKLYNYISRVIFSFEDRKDVLQDTLFTIFKNKNKFNPNKGSFKNFAMAICQFQVKRYLTAHKRNREVAFTNLNVRSDHSNAWVPDATDLVLESELEDLNELKNKIINNIYSTLEPKWRLMAILHFKKGCSYSDIGKIINKSHGYIGPTIMRIKRNLITKGQECIDSEYRNTHI